MQRFTRIRRNTLVTREDHQTNEYHHVKQALSRKIIVAVSASRWVVFQTCLCIAMFLYAHYMYLRARLISGYVMDSGFFS